MEANQQPDLGQMWMHHMRCGQYEKAWAISDMVMQQRGGAPTWHLPRHQQPIWNGQSLVNKRVLVRCYHGLGDTIQFIRFAPMLKAVASKVMVWTQPALIPLLETVEGIDELLPLHDGTPGVHYDVDVEVMELPYIFRASAHSLPATSPYIHVDAFRDNHTFPNRVMNVGLVWKPGPYAPQRGVPFNELRPLANVPGVRLHILQADAKTNGWTDGFGVHPGEFSLYDYARYIKGLDLLISIDSMPVHLAAAMGVPVFTLLHSPADWRWMYQGDRSPWYPSMRLFRQQQPGEWKPVVHELTAELHKVASRHLHVKIAA